MLKNILSFIQKILGDSNESTKSYEKPSGGLWKPVQKNVGTSNSGKGIWTNIKPKQTTPSQRTIQYTFDQKERIATIANKLQQFANGKRPVNWQPSRFLYKVGEMRLAEATVSLKKIAQRPQYQRFVLQHDYRYSLIYALARCGDASVLESIERLVQNNEQATIKRLALDAFLSLAAKDDVTKISTTLVEYLPADVDVLIQKEQPTQEDLQILFPIDSELEMPPLYILYLLSNQHSDYRVFVLNAVKNLPLAFPYFQTLRYIYKSAEFREDYEVLGVLSQRMDGETASFTTRTTWKWDSATRSYSSSRVREKKRAFSNRTKAYFQKRIVRKLQLLGEQEREEFCQFSTTILQHYQDYNSTPLQERDVRYVYENRRYQRHTTHYMVFKQVVLAYLTQDIDNESVTLIKNTSKYKFLNDYYQQNLTIRTEPFKDLWNRYPQYILSLLLTCKSNYVAAFAIKLIKDHEALVTREVILELLKSESLEKVTYALEKLNKYIQFNTVDTDIWEVLLNAPLGKTRQFAIDWLTLQPEVFLASPDFIKIATFSSYDDIAKWLRQNSATIKISDTDRQSIFANLVRKISTRTNEKEAKILYKNALGIYPNQMRQTPIATAVQLLAHDLENVQLLGSKILLFQKDKIAEIPEKVIAQMMTGKYLSIRYQGLELFGEMPLDLLLQKRDILVSLAISKDPEIRKKVKPIIQKSAQGKPAWGVQLCQFFVPLLLQAETYEGLHVDILDLLTEYLSENLAIVSHQQIWALTASHYREANLLGLSLLPEIDFQQEALRDIITLAHHEMPAVRQQCFDYFHQQVGRIRYESEEALRILDSKWEESRNFAFDFFATHYKAGDWTPELLISVCDSTRPDVQEFGKKMMTTFFTSEHGADYLLKLSQHPSVSLQLFATNYLAEFATDNLAHFIELKPYFRTVLTQIYKGGATKKAVFNFLENEAQKNVIIASHVIEILNEVSLTVAIGDKAKCIQVLHGLKKRFPQLDSVLEVVAT